VIVRAIDLDQQAILAASVTVLPWASVTNFVFACGISWMVPVVLSLNSNTSRS